MKCPSCGNPNAECVIGNYWSCPGTGCSNTSKASPASPSSKGAFYRMRELEWEDVAKPRVWINNPVPASSRGNPLWPSHIPQFDMKTHVWTGYVLAGIADVGDPFTCGSGRKFYKTPMEAMQNLGSNYGSRVDCVVCLSGIDGDACGWVSPFCVGAVVWKGIP